MSLVLGDSHGEVEKVRRFLEHRPEEEHIFAGDLLDSFTASREQQYECLKLALQSGAQLVLGNHEMHYFNRPPFICSGRDELFSRSYRPHDLMLRHRTQLYAALARDGWLITHAGLCEELLQPGGVEAQADWLNAELDNWFKDNRKDKTRIFDCSVVRGGDKEFSGPFWLHYKREAETLATRIKQVFGHTPGDMPVVFQTYVALDTTYSRDVWVFDTASGHVYEILP